MQARTSGRQGRRLLGIETSIDVINHHWAPEVVLEDALGARSKVRIVRELARRGNDEVTTDDLAKATGQSTGTLVPALQQLALAGVISTRLVGKSRVFRLAADYPLGVVLKRIFEEESVAIHRQAEEILRKAGRDGIRYAFWVFDPSESEDRRRALWLVAIADDASKVETALVNAAGQLSPFSVRVIGVEATRKAVLANDEEHMRLIERGRIVFADKTWLDTK
ncbi:MAG: winged helix-turn-helix transcriptional regulator [Euryarchaeota archaeon]|nr:winged helix-turn-helix transcriptional regulator [Euryarchaeota archaeon]